MNLMRTIYQYTQRRLESVFPERSQFLAFWLAYRATDYPACLLSSLSGIETVTYLGRVLLPPLRVATASFTARHELIRLSTSL